MKIWSSFEIETFSGRKEQKKNRFALNNFRNSSIQLQPIFILKYEKKNYSKGVTTHFLQ